MTTLNESPGNATFDCGCGFHIVDGSDDVDGFYEAIDDHEQWCPGPDLDESRAWDDASGTPEVPAFIADQVAADREAARRAALREAARQVRLAEADARTAGQAAELDEVTYPGFRRLFAALVAAVVGLAGLIWWLS